MLGFFSDNVWKPHWFLWVVTIVYNLWLCCASFGHRESLVPRTMEEMLCTIVSPGKLWWSQQAYLWHKSKASHENWSWYNFHLPTDCGECCHYHTIFTTVYHNLLPFYLPAYNSLLKILVLLCSLLFPICVCVCFIAGIHFLGLFKLLIGKVERNTIKAKYTSCSW